MRVPAYALALAAMAVLTAPRPFAADTGELMNEARKAAIEGDHARCAQLSDRVRKTKDGPWQAHKVFASCAALEAQAKKASLGKEKYEARVLEAIEAIDGLLGDGSTLTSRQQLQFSFMAIEMRKQLERDIAEWGQ